MTHPSGSFVERWWFSLLLIPFYLGTFHYWTTVREPTAIKLSGTVVAALMMLILIVAHRRGYFYTNVDAIGHGVVILDLVLEAWKVPAEAHRHLDFYGCAAAFTVVLGAYRYYRMKQYLARTAETDAADEDAEA